MIKEITIKEFQDTGMVWYLNQQLHLFGLALVVKTNKDGTQQLTPCECKFRGFDENTIENGYKNLTKYIEQNMERIKQDIE